MPQREIYLLSPRALSPETIAVAFAKTSRSPESFRDIAAELSDQKSAQFHEKWVVGYGHASVAEHAVLHIAFENVSRLAIESIESNRLASYTEKSTRYQKWDVNDFTIPPELDGHPLGNPFEGYNFNLGGGAMPGLDAQSRYGSGIGGAFNRLSQDPRFQSLGQGAGAFGAINAGATQPQQLSPELLRCSSSRCRAPVDSSPRSRA